MISPTLKKGLNLAITIILVLGLSISFQSLLADWQAPTAPPPTNNLYLPVYNDGGDIDIPVVNKFLTVNDDFAAGLSGAGPENVLYVDDTNERVGIGSNTPFAALSVEGKIVADPPEDSDPDNTVATKG